MVWRLLALEKTIIELDIPSAMDGATSSTSQLSKTKRWAGSGVIVAVALGLGVALGVNVALGLGLAVGLGVALGLALGVGFAVSVGLALGGLVGLAVNVGDCVCVGRGVAVGWLSALQAPRSMAITGINARHRSPLQNMTKAEVIT